ncbi:TIGR04338 family metallohydrolase [Nocardia cyriacigeorgica]|uniref:TIGR04338 family metallohydrolase n=1 Tax=Nocardia cyriacigeorgica TaxID=135487 RepID=A0A6P1D621_9NOCA|nr:TIGR04338 family metallohydrolase [Nocardia cyriacigeorgica]NEW46086.1 TIGR04338 family metallohydrolase [Nocardia cyriacigeorgica]NEW49555.1 TIGR04338 family metallohydrolase [Nocardia cyriacigeorgica]NEW59269.1 TIGR04338 family metallohydrolase [Nocardia cyriacigeorgica]
MTVRDTQRAKVYDAEQLVRGAFDRADEFGNRTVEVFGSQITLPVERRFASVDSVQSYCDRVLALNWVAAQWSRASSPVRVRTRAGTTAAHYEADGAVLAVPLHTGGAAWALRELVVLHELTHHLEPQPRECAPHGPEFCSRYVELVDGVIGPEAALLLRGTMIGCGVGFA